MGNITESPVDSLSSLWPMTMSDNLNCSSATAKRPAMRLVLVSFLLSGFILVQPPVFGKQITDESEKLARCVGVLPYAVNLMMLQNNTGAAKVLLLQAARANTALFAANLEGGKVPGWKMKIFEELTDGLREYFSNYPERLRAEIDVCVSATNLVLKRESKEGTRLWGLSIQEMVDAFRKSLSEQVGL
jgi:hypothetical protein